MPSIGPVRMMTSLQQRSRQLWEAVADPEWCPGRGSPESRVSGGPKIEHPPPARGDEASAVGPRSRQGPSPGRGPGFRLGTQGAPRTATGGLYSPEHGWTEGEMIVLRPAAQRGRTDHGWLESRHTFSFGDYRDSRHVGFRRLRVINEDRMQPGRGFGTRPHEDMEMLSYVLDGTLAHKDSLGKSSVLRQHEFQCVSAGRGVAHNEYNPSGVELVHFLPILDPAGPIGDRAKLPAARASPGQEEGTVGTRGGSGRSRRGTRRPSGRARVRDAPGDGRERPPHPPPGTLRLGPGHARRRCSQRDRHVRRRWCCPRARGGRDDPCRESGGGAALRSRLRRGPRRIPSATRPRTGQARLPAPGVGPPPARSPGRTS